MFRYKNLSIIVVILFTWLGVSRAEEKASASSAEAEVQLLIDQGKEGAANRRLKKWMSENENAPEPWVMAAKLQYDAKKYKKTLSLGEKALRKSPQCAEAFYWRGRAYEALKKPLDAENEYRAALKSEPTFTAAKEALDRLQSELGTSPESAATKSN